MVRWRKGRRGGRSVRNRGAHGYCDESAVCKRQIHHNTLELAQTEALQKVTRQHVPTEARGFVFLGRDRLRGQMRE